MYIAKYQAFTMLFSLNNDTLRLFLAKNIFVQEIIHATSLCVFPCGVPRISRITQIFLPFYFFTLLPLKVPRRSHPAKHGEGFDAPPTLERSGSEHQRAVTSFPSEKGRLG